ncbi:MAG: hypothetical protein ABIJ59_18515 [Pseudomonadota bacterium]
MFKKHKFFFGSIIALLIIGMVPTTYVLYKIYEYKTYIWLPSYILKGEKNKIKDIKNGHVMFLFVDHHEPGYSEKGPENEKNWCLDYKENIQGLFDDFENPFQYSWFYAYDHLNFKSLSYLNELVYSGLGEIELHWHHGPDDIDSFSNKLKGAIDWYKQAGSLISSDEKGSTHFGFIHGNWCLDNSCGDDSKCGVNRELDVLKQHGCYADFTFSTLSTISQPKLVNRIYYAKDSNEQKSYNQGIVSHVGIKPEGLMIFQGPICWDWKDLQWDDAAFEPGSPFKPHRIKLWLDWAPSVTGKPDWLFVKVHTHGIQAKSLILSENFREMVLELKQYCKENNLFLHFVTSREAYNIVKAAENGKQGNPEDYRDYIIKKPRNRG